MRCEAKVRYGRYTLKGKSRYRRQRRETEDISRTRVRAIVCRRHPLCDCAPGAHPQENLSYPAGPLLFLGVLG